MSTSIGIDQLPEGCLAAVLSLTTPPDACRFSVLSRIFRSAAGSDTVWENFLPSDYKDIISEAVADSLRQLLAHLSKKQLYLRLCDDPLLIDGGKKSFFLDKRTGKKCYMIAAEELAIAWGNAPQYWNWVSLPESRFSQVAVLNSVCWLALNGEISSSVLSIKTHYAAYFVYKLTRNTYGFKNQSVEVSAGVRGVLHNRRVFLDPESRRRNNEGLPTARNDGWLEIEMGEYFREGDYDDGDLEKRNDRSGD